MGFIFPEGIEKSKKSFEGKPEKEQLLMTHLPSLSLQIPELLQSRGRITVREVVTLRAANRNTVKKHLKALVEKKLLQQNGIG